MITRVEADYFGMITITTTIMALYFGVVTITKKVQYDSHYNYDYAVSTVGTELNLNETSELSTLTISLYLSYAYGELHAGISNKDYLRSPNN